jgi:hypothetical protein
MDSVWQIEADLTGEVKDLCWPLQLSRTPDRVQQGPAELHSPDLHPNPVALRGEVRQWLSVAAFDPDFPTPGYRNGVSTCIFQHSIL